jgi:16S rRNA (uracil1498-N3)-methyltransferase
MTIFIPSGDIAQRKGISLDADKSRYLTSVLRSREGDAVTVIDGKGKAYTASITGISNKSVIIDIIAEVPLHTESSSHLVLCQGILKGEKMDLVIQKVTELGIKEIIPVITERCLVKETRKLRRWRKIAEEAAEQCGRAVVPSMHEPINFKELVMGDWSGGTGANPKGLIFWEQGGLPLTEALKKLKESSSSPAPITSLFIGPEGGFAAEEIRLAEEKGLIRATLGKRILRAETAAVVSVALLQFLLEEQ